MATRERRSSGISIRLGVAAGLVFISATPQAQQVDRNLAATASSISCFFEDEQKIGECVSRHLPAIQWRTDYASATSATFSVEVTFKNIKNADGTARRNLGTAFLVDRAKRYLVTAKHVLLGDRLEWTTRLQNHGFSDLETAIEDYVKPNNVEIQARPSGYTKGVNVTLVALDRSSDLALLQAASLEELAIYNRPHFRALQFKDDYRCAGVNNHVFAIGYTAEPPATISFSNPEMAGCNLQPKNAYLGGIQYRFSLYDTKSDFEPGMSGGPVLDDASMRVVGVVSGATIGTSRKFFTPLPALKAFLSRF